MAAQWLDGAAEVTPRAPQPPDKPLHVQQRDQGIALFDADVLIAEALPTTVSVDP